MTGSLQTKNGKYYAVISYKDNSDKRKQKWISTNLPVKGNKKKDFLRIISKSMRTRTECLTMICIFIHTF